jgi:(+)-trans-carveol dehydrogenase
VLGNYSHDHVTGTRIRSSGRFGHYRSRSRVTAGCWVVHDIEAGKPLSGRVEGKVAFITGAARGQGRSHAIRLAEEGADIIAVDLCDQIDSVPFAMASPEDLTETVRLVEALDRRIVAVRADVRDYDALEAALGNGVDQLGRLDIVSANAGIFSAGLAVDLTQQTWQDMIDVNLTGVWHTAKAAVPHMIAGGRGGSIVITSSSAALKAYQHTAHYTAAKTGVMGLMRILASELAPHFIRVNTIHPGGVDTPMLDNETMYRLYRPDVEHLTRDEFGAAHQEGNLLPVRWMDPVDISNALLFLASDESRYITGVALPVDAGSAIK